MPAACLRLAVVLLLAGPLVLRAEDERAYVPPSPWVLGVGAGAMHQFSAGLDAGGAFSADRLNAGVSLTRVLQQRHTVTLALGYGYSVYDFSRGLGAAAATAPWDDVQTLSLAVPVQWHLDQTWTLLATPFLSATAETSADLGDGVTGGALLGATYSVTQRLTLGLGVYAASRIADEATIVPVPILDWRVTDTVQLATDTTGGPGLFLRWQATPALNLGAGARYDALRFRLADDALVPGGVGQDRGVALLVTGTYAFFRQGEVTLQAGVRAFGELRVEDDDGNAVVKDDYGPAPFAGIAFNWRY